MKTLLCFGDSNTWGQVPVHEFVKLRHPPEVRWTGRLQRLAGDSLKVIEEGNNGRTTGLEDPIRPGRNAATYLQGCLDSHAPLDAIIFMLGTNDLKKKFAPSPAVITERMEKLVRTAKEICIPTPRIFVFAPVIVKPQHYSSDDLHYPEAVAYSEALVGYYRAMAARQGVEFFDASSVVTASPEDGVHFDEANHALLADAVWKLLKPWAMAQSGSQ